MINDEELKNYMIKHYGAQFLEGCSSQHIDKVAQNAMNLVKEYLWKRDADGRVDVNDARYKELEENIKADKLAKIGPRISGKIP